MSTILATAYDSKYPWGAAWKASLVEKCNIPFEIINTDSISTQMPNGILQHGEFLDHLGPVDPADVIIFSDADCILQRPFSEAELSLFSRLRFGDIAAQYNFGPFTTLAFEGVALGKTKRQVDKQWLDEFNGFKTMPVFCTGVVAATRESWMMCRKWFEKHWLSVDSVWHHYAKVQWLMSYVFSRYMNPVVFMEETTQQPLAGRVPGLEMNGDMAYINGKMLAIRHALALNPPKVGGCPDEAT